MAAPEARTDRRLELLAKLVRQRRTSLRLSADDAASRCRVAPMTYRKVEGDKNHQGVGPASATTYAKIETGLDFRPGSCQAVLDGADSITLTDGTEIISGAQITHPTPEQVEEGVKQAMSKVAGLYAPELTHGQTEAMSDDFVKELQKRGILPSAS
ncbi:hypothetical protein [Streptomyces sp. SR-10]|uniref:hypothetical protein n=1 Tax=Streptomyces sp. SR-10 TaxID=3416442 RepID=UPI003CF199EB